MRLIPAFPTLSELLKSVQWLKSYIGMSGFHLLNLVRPVNFRNAPRYSSQLTTHIIYVVICIYMRLILAVPTLLGLSKPVHGCL